MLPNSGILSLLEHCLFSDLRDAPSFILAHWSNAPHASCSLREAAWVYMSLLTPIASMPSDLFRDWKLLSFTARPMFFGPPPSSPAEATDCHQPHAISLSMPASPSGHHFAQAKKSYSLIKLDQLPLMGNQNNLLTLTLSTHSNQNRNKFHAQPIPAGNSFESRLSIPRNDRGTKGSILSRHGLESLKDNYQTYVESHRNQIWKLMIAMVPKLRLCLQLIATLMKALEGPELDTSGATEESVLPEDKEWPFLLRFPICSFGMCLGVRIQAILWKNLATSPSTSLLYVSLTVNPVLGCISLALVATVSLIYSLKIIFYFEAVRREHHHPIRANSSLLRG